MLIRSARNRPALEVAGAETPVVGGGSPAPVPIAAGLPPNTISLLPGRTVRSLGAMAGAEVPVGLPTARYDATHYAAVRIIVELRTPAASGTSLVLHYRRVDAGPSALWASAGAPNPASVRIDRAANLTFASAAVTLAPDAAADCEWMIVGVGGDGVTVPEVRNVYIQFVPNAAPTRTPCTDYDGCSLETLGHYHEDWSEWSTIEEFEAWQNDEWRPPYSFWYGWGFRNCEIDTCNTYNGHPVMVSRRDPLQDFTNAGWWADMVDSSENYVQASRVAAAVIVKFDPDFYVPDDDEMGLTIIQVYDSGPGFDYFIPGMYLRHDGLWLNVWRRSPHPGHLVKMATREQVCDGTWKYIDVRCDVSKENSSGVAYGIFGDACGPTIYRTIAANDVVDPRHMSNFDFFNPTYWVGGAPKAYEYRIAEWGMRHGSVIILPDDDE